MLRGAHPVAALLILLPLCVFGSRVLHDIAFQSRLVSIETARAEFPWQIALAVVDNGADDSSVLTSQCGGALISPGIVATAAHCIEHPTTRALVYPLDRLRVVLGVNALDGLSTTDPRVYGIKSYVVHPSFGDDGGDLALIYLDKCTQVPGIKVASPNQDSASTAVTLLSWGPVDCAKNEHGPQQSFKLKRTDMKVVSFKHDQFCMKNDEPPPSASKVLCLESATGLPPAAVNLCSGDSGGVGVVTTSPGAYYLASVLSRGQTLNGVLEVTNTRLSQFNQWLYSAASQDTCGTSGVTLPAPPVPPSQPLVTPAPAPAAPNPVKLMEEEKQNIVSPAVANSSPPAVSVTSSSPDERPIVEGVGDKKATNQEESDRSGSSANANANAKSTASPPTTAETACGCAPHVSCCPQAQEDTCKCPPHPTCCAAQRSLTPMAQLVGNHKHGAYKQQPRKL